VSEPVAAAPYYFISYARQNADFVARLTADLKKNGLTVWVDTQNLQPGTPDWEANIRAAIKDAQAVVLAASDASRRSQPVSAELAIADSHQRPIYAVWAHGDQWINSIEMPRVRLQYIDMRGDKYQPGLERLLKALRGGALTATQDQPGTPRVGQEAPRPINWMRLLRTFARPLIGLLIMVAVTGIGALGVLALRQMESRNAAAALNPPVRIINRAPFSIDRYEVSNRQYRLCVEVNACTGLASGAAVPLDDLPIVNVSASQAAAFCRWLGRRLPTSAEWLYAAVQDGGTPRRWPWGEQSPDPTRHVVAIMQAGGTIRQPSGPTRVDAPQYLDGDTPAGLRHMLGNVSEWTSTVEERQPGDCTERNTCAQWDGQGEPPGKLYAMGMSWRSALYPEQFSGAAYFSPARGTLDFIGFRCAGD
jgi:hypothetical protein